MARKSKLNIEVAIDSRKALAGGRQVEGVLGGIGRKAGVASAAGVGLQSVLLAVGGAAVLGSLYALNKALDATLDSIARASQEYASFGQELRNVGAVSGATREQVASLSDEALRLASATRFSPDETVQSLYNLASAGLAVEEQLAALPSVLDFAEAAQADLGLSTELVTRNLKAFRLEATESRRVADVLTASIGASALNAQRLSVGMAQAAPAAGVLGQSLETTTAALAILVDQMGSGEMAGAGLKQAMLTLMDSAGDLGVEVLDAEGKFRDLVDIIRDLEDAGAQGEQILSELGTRAGPAMSILVQEGSDALATMRDRISSTGQAAQVAGEQLDTLQGDLDIFQSAIDELWITYGQQLESGTRRLAQANTAVLRAATEAIRQHGDEIEAVWVTTVEAMIDVTRRFAISIAAVIDMAALMGLKFSDVLSSLSTLPGFRELNDTLSVFMALTNWLDQTASGAGPAERAVREFFDELERGAGDAASAMDELHRVSNFEAIVKPLEALGVSATNLRDLDELKRILKELADMEPASVVAGTGRRQILQAQLEILERQREELDRQFRVRRELREEARRQLAIDQQILDAYEELSGITAPTGVVGDAILLEVPEFELPDLDISEELEAELSAGYAAFVKASETAELSAFIAENLTRGIQGALASGLSEFFKTGKLEFEDFFNTVADLAANILGEVLAAELTRVMEQNMQQGGGIGGMFGGATGTALAVGITASNIQGADDQGYAAAGAALGAAIGAGIGAWFTGGAGAATGAKWGAVIGSWLGSMVKHGAPSFTGALEAEMGTLDLKGQLSYMGGTMGQDIAEGAERILSALGGTLESLSADITLEMREGLAVFVNGIRTYFDSEHISEGIQFAIVEALKNADISGISDEARAALENTTADTMEELLSDLDFARWIEQLDLTDSARALDDFVDQFRIAWDRMIQLGIDGAEKLAQWASKSLEDQRRSILGLQETADERIRREAAGFNAEVQLIRAEQETRRAELTIRREQLAAEVSMLQAHGEIMQQRITIDGEILRGERNLLAGKLAMLEAIDNALAAVDALLEGLPDLISDEEINRAIRNAGRGAGPTEDDREAARRTSEGFGLSDIAQQLLTATTFVERHMESIADLGFSEAELADERRRAHEEQQQMIRDLGRSALAGLGTTSVATIQRMQDLGIHLAFLRNNFEELGLTAEQLMQATRELGQEITLSVASGLARYIEDADVRRELQVLEHELFMEQKRIEIIAAHTMGLITEAQYQMLLDLLDLASEWEPPDESEVTRPARIITRSFDDARRNAERIQESFRRAKESVAEFLNEVLVGQHGGVSPIGGVLEAQRQFEEVVRQAMTGNVGAIENFDDYGRTLLRLAEEAYGSSPEFQAIRDFVLAAGRDILGLRQGREGNLIFDERFYANGEAQLSEQRRMSDLLARIERHLSAGAERRIVRGAVN